MGASLRADHTLEASLDDDDGDANSTHAFVLDAGRAVYTNFGGRCGVLERNMATAYAMKFTASRHGRTKVVNDKPDAFRRALKLAHAGRDYFVDK